MRKIILITLVSLFALTNIVGQGKCDLSAYNKLIREGNAFAAKNKYEKAVDKYSAAIIACPDKASDAKKKIVGVFRKVDELKDEAENEKLTAQSLVLAATAKYMLDIDPTKALSLAEEAYNLKNKKHHLCRRTLSNIYNNISQNGTPIYRSFKNGNGGKRVIFSSNGLTFLVDASPTTRLLDLSGNEIHSYRGYNPVFSPDETKILTTEPSYHNKVKLWDISGEFIADFKGHTSFVNSSVFSPDGTKILTASDDKTAKLWDLSGNLIADFKGHTDFVESAVFSPDGAKVLTASDDNTAKLWNLSGKVITKFKGHTDIVFSATFSPNGNQIITSSQDKTVKLWYQIDNDFKEKKIISANSATFSSDGKKILSISGTNSYLWDLSGNIIAGLGGNYQFRLATFSPDETKILLVSGNNAFLFDLSGSIIAEFSHSKFISSAIFSTDGENILTSSFDKTTKMWDLAGNLITTIKESSEGMSAVFSPDKAKLLSVSMNNTAKLWDLSGNLITDFTSSIKNERYARSAIFSPNGLFVFTISCCALWDLSGNKIGKFKAYGKSVRTAVFSSNGNKILTASRDNTASLWDLSGKLLMNFEGHTNSVNSAIFSHDEMEILTASDDGSAKIWDLSGTIIADFKGHTNKVNSAVFSPDDTKVLTASEDGTAKLWLTLKGINKWIKTANIYKLTKEDYKEMGLNFMIKKEYEKTNSITNTYL